MEKTSYVCGFIFDPPYVLLIRKERPEWQKGYLNGVGGHIEAGETPRGAMVREFKEETSIVTQPDDWRHFCTLSDCGREIFFFSATISRESFVTARSMTDEYVEVIHIDRLPCDVIPNLRWLIPMALVGGHGLECDGIVYEIGESQGG